MPKKGRIFISYRREDASGDARSIFQRLERAFGKDQLFMDVISIQKGRDFRTALDEHLSDCRIMLAVIGPNWLGAGGGASSLDDDTDFVRMELAAALSRDIPVIPVLVRGAALPKKDVLPAELQPLMFRQSARVSHDQFARDMDGLEDDIRGLLGRSNIRVLPIALTVAAVLSFAAILHFDGISRIRDFVGAKVDVGAETDVGAKNDRPRPIRTTLRDDSPPRRGSAIYIANLSFLDAESKAVMPAGDAELINQAVEEGMKNLSKADPKYVINDPTPKLPNTDANAQKLSKFYWDANLARTDKIDKIINELMEPSNVEGLVSGQFGRLKDGTIAVRTFVIDREPDLRSQAKEFNEAEFYCSENQERFLCDDARKAISAAVVELLSSCRSDTCLGRGRVHVANLSFLDADSRSVMPDGDAKLINQAVEEGFRALAQVAGGRFVSSLTGQLPNTDANAQKLSNIYWDASLDKSVKIKKIVRALMEPNMIDGLVAGQFDQHKDGMISVRPFVISRQMKTFMTEAKQFTETEFYCTDPNLPGRKVLCEKTREEIRDIIIRLLRQL